MRDGERINFVLVHGGFHGGWCWRDVVDILRGHGHRVFAPTLTGLGERSHLLRADPGLEDSYRDIRNLILHEELHNVVLVGHSLAGGPVSLVADRMPEAIATLIYLDSVLTEPGRSVLDTMPPDVARKRREMAAQTGNGTMPPPPAAAFDLHEPELAAWVERHLTHQPFRAYTDPWLLENPLGNGIATAYVTCTAPYCQATEAGREIAVRQAGWDLRELACSHDAMVVAPELTADLLIDIARTSRGE